MLMCVVLSACVFRAPAGDDQVSSSGLAVTTQLGDHAQFVEGDTARLLISLDRDAYVAVLLQDASGRVTQIYPAIEIGSSLWHRAGAFQALPTPDAGYPVVAPFGRERVWAIASAQPLPTLTVASALDGGRTSDVGAAWRQDLERFRHDCRCFVATSLVEFTTKPADDVVWPP